VPSSPFHSEARVGQCLDALRTAIRASDRSSRRHEAIYLSVCTCDGGHEMIKSGSAGDPAACRQRDVREEAAMQKTVRRKEWGYAAFCVVAARWGPELRVRQKAPKRSRGNQLRLAFKLTIVWVLAIAVVLALQSSLHLHQLARVHR